ncbi:MAG TPA: helix-turn-helix transcriptional regulator [Bacilli bacterium]|nr:helix-turn-helix transcriptional regulator [Bacilli bacterium]
MSIGSNIKDLRKKRKLSQIELANKLNIEREVLVNWEHNLEIPNETQIMQIASILGVAYSDIVSSDQHIRSVQKAETEKMENLFTPYLQSGESLHWTGKPQSRLNFVTLPVTLFGLFFLGFALFWTIAAMQTALEMAFFGIPFIVVGFFLVFGKKTWMKRISGHVYYGVTNKRILILTRGQ